MVPGRSIGTSTSNKPSPDVMSRMVDAPPRWGRTSSTGVPIRLPSRITGGAGKFQGAGTRLQALGRAGAERSTESRWGIRASRLSTAAVVPRADHRAQSKHQEHIAVNAPAHVKTAGIHR
jgi:hypothetical protein